MLRVVLLLVLASPLVSFAQPTLRPEVLLDGTWQFSGDNGIRRSLATLDYWDRRFPSVRVGTYEREVTVPADWTAPRIVLDFAGVLHQAKVYIDGTRITEHFGGWLPFSADVTGLVGPGDTFQLQVEVQGAVGERFIENGQPIYPDGWYGHQRSWGLTDHVWLRGYGTVFIDDAFIQTSVREQTLTVDYTVVNTTDIPRTVAIAAQAEGDNGIGFETEAQFIAEGDTATFSITVPWADATHWQPGQPYLYQLHSQVLEGAEVLDEERQRFGFREFWIDGDGFFLNGIPVDLFGDSVTMHHESFLRGYLNETYNFTADRVRDTVARMLEANIRVIRFHQAPAFRWMLDVCDELGMLVISESAIYARDYLIGNNKPRYQANALDWAERWIKSERNHPSIIFWSAENEMQQAWMGPYYDVPQANVLGALIKANDPTRPVTFEGTHWEFNREGPDGLDTDIPNYPYPERIGNRPVGSIYQWTWMQRDAQPTGVGEFLFWFPPYTEEGRGSEDEFRYWQGTLTRGFRYLDIDDIRPYRLDWVWGPATFDAKARYLINSIAPVALFDKAYDDLGVAPMTEEAYPVVTEGRYVDRTLVLHNDGLRGTQLTAHVTVEHDGEVHAEGRFETNVALSEWVEIPYSFQAPAVGSETFDVVLRVEQNGEVVFEERRPFTTDPAGIAGAPTDATIRFAHIEPLPVQRIEAETSLSGTTPDALLDGDMTTTWRTRGTNSPVTLDLGEQRRVSYVDVAASASGTFWYGFNIETSRDGETWTRVSNRARNTGGQTLETFDIDDTVARYVRLLANGFNHNGGVSVFSEVAVYGSTDTTGVPQASQPAFSTILGTVEAGRRVYPVTLARFGTPAYSAGEAFIGAIPDRFVDALLIQARSSHRTRTDSVYVTFELRQALNVFVGYDDRATALPAWLSDWHDTGETISTEGPDAANLRLYQKGFGVGTVELGGNMQAPAAGAQANYIVLIVPSIRTDAEAEPVLPDFGLEVPFPNPTATSATLRYQLPRASEASVTVYDLLGRAVATLAEGHHAPGTHTARLDATTLAPGLYLVRLRTPQHQQVQRLLVAR
ncbi:MAG: glycoside hydrolase family 2 TIM barrel-domain containing protein [Bacteroidota bacterium]